MPGAQEGRKSREMKRETRKEGKRTLLIYGVSTLGTAYRWKMLGRVQCYGHDVL